MSSARKREVVCSTEFYCEEDEVKSILFGRPMLSGLMVCDLLKLKQVMPSSISHI